MSDCQRDFFKNNPKRGSGIRNNTSPQTFLETIHRTEIEVLFCYSYYYIIKTDVLRDEGVYLLCEKVSYNVIF